MMTPTGYCAALVLAALFLGGAAHAQSTSALVLNAPELDENAAFALETRLRTSAAALLPELLGRSQTRALVESTRAVGVLCATSDTKCLTDLGVVLGVPTLVFLDVQPTEGGFAVSGALVDVQRSSVPRRIDTSVGPALLSEEAGPAVRRLLLALLAPERTGSLQVSVSPPGAKVVVDGEELPAPSEPVIGLIAGSHVVEVTLEGHERHEEAVSVDAGQQTELTLALRPLEPDNQVGEPGDELAWYLAGGATLGAGLLVGIGGGALGYWAALASAEVPNAELREEGAAASSFYGGVTIGAVIGGGALVAAGAALVTTGLLLGGE